LNPLWILVIGIAAVLVMILVLRVHAFLALITAAMIVGLLSGNVPVDQKIAKVAEAFGTVAGKIGIVIALAAIIGKCLMDSGAADRIVRSFMAVLGEKRAHFALLLSGYVLSVPVFFDTVFYLLVPLGRATRIRTGKRYVFYIMAILAGGVATHSLVPPTPGPLAAGETLRVDIGLVILVGMVVALVASVIPLLVYGGILSRFMDIPLRETSDISLEELEELSRRPASQLPSLTLSLAPIVLPVILITANTVLTALARTEAEGFETGGGQWSAEAGVWEFGPPNSGPEAAHEGSAVAATVLGGDHPEKGESRLVSGPVQLPALGANEQLQLRFQQWYAYDENDRGSVQISVTTDGQWSDWQTVADAAPTGSSDGWKSMKIDLSAYAGQRVRLAFHHQASPPAEDPGWYLDEVEIWRGKVSGVTYADAARVAKVFGNANFALLLSTVIALHMLARQKGLNLRQLAAAVQPALASAGVIILITAGGGSFGGMLQEAGVGEEIRSIAEGQQLGGLAWLLLAFVVASTLKVAQGSGTVSIVVTSSMMYSMLPGATELGYNYVYVALAVGCGSMVGSWMNDSGFWVVCQMSGFTPEETLRVMTVLLVVMGLVGLATTMLMALWLPLLGG
jgi:H+/gluconate symporter-like permease